MTNSDTAARRSAILRALQDLPESETYVRDLAARFDLPEHDAYALPLAGVLAREGWTVDDLYRAIG